MTLWLTTDKEIETQIFPNHLAIGLGRRWPTTCPAEDFPVWALKVPWPRNSLRVGKLGPLVTIPSDSTVSLQVDVLVAQSCPAHCDLMGCKPPGNSVHGTVQARGLDWVALSFSEGCSRPGDQTWISRIAGLSHLSHHGSPLLWACWFHSSGLFAPAHHHLPGKSQRPRDGGKNPVGSGERRGWNPNPASRSSSWEHC